MKRTLSLIVLALLIQASPGLFARPAQEASASGGGPGPVPIKGRIILSTTTSTQDSGLLDFLLPVFTRETGWEVDVIAVGTGAALKMGRDGDADVLLVHSKADELELIADGFGIKRFDVMYNDYLVVGPGLREIPYNSDIMGTFKDIASKRLAFVSRGDNSGTHIMERNLWRAAGIDPAGLAGYISAGQGMGATLQITDEMRAYTLTDRATWLAFSKDKKIDLPAVCEKDSGLLNYYGVIAVNPAAFSGTQRSRINTEGAQAFVNWMLSDSTQKLIGQYGIAEYGDALFTPNAGANSIAN